MPHGQYLLSACSHIIRQIREIRHLNYQCQCGMSQFRYPFFHQIHIFNCESNFCTFFFKKKNINWRLPFDTKNPIGYFIAVFIQYIHVISVMVTVETLMIFCAGTSFMMFPLTKDIKNNLKTINHYAKYKKHRPKIIDQLSHFIKFHSKSIQLSEWKSFIFEMTLCQFTMLNNKVRSNG